MSNFQNFEYVKSFDSLEELYVCAIGFEDRSFGSNEFLLKNKFKTKNTIAIKYTTYVKENEKDRGRLEQLLNKFSESISYTIYDSEDRQKAEEMMIKEFNDFKECKTVTINISSFKTHLLIWMLNYALENFERVRIIYTEPEGYGNQLEGEKVFASGVKDIFTTPEFSGALLPGYLSLLIIFLGYDFARARGTYEMVQPSKKIGIMGKPNTPKIESKFEEIKKEHLKNFGSNDDFLECSIFDLNNVIHELTKIRTGQIETSNISIALNGSKLHAISALLFAKKFKDIQLIASTPSEYHPSNYSYGVRDTLQCEITKKEMEDFLSS